METGSEWFVQNGREHGWCSLKWPHGVAASYLQCGFFLHIGSKNVIHSKAQRKCWPHAVQQGAARRRRDLMQCFQIQSKVRRTSCAPKLNLGFQKSAQNFSEMEKSKWESSFRLNNNIKWIFFCGSAAIVPLFWSQGSSVPQRSALSRKFALSKFTKAELNVKHSHVLCPCEHLNTGLPVCQVKLALTKVLARGSRRKTRKTAAGRY